MPACPAMIIHPKTEMQPGPDSIPETAAGVAGGSTERPRIISGDSPARLPRPAGLATVATAGGGCTFCHGLQYRPGGSTTGGRRCPVHGTAGGAAGTGQAVRRATDPAGGNVSGQHPEPATVNGKVLSAPSVALLHSFCPSVPSALFLHDFSFLLISNISFWRFYHVCNV